jgi:hypothetical protein
MCFQNPLCDPISLCVSKTRYATLSPYVFQKPRYPPRYVTLSAYVFQNPLCDPISLCVSKTPLHPRYVTLCAYVFQNPLCDPICLCVSKPAG